MERLFRCKNLGEYGVQKLSICVTSKRERKIAARNAKRGQQHIRRIFIEFAMSRSPTQHYSQSYYKVALIWMKATHNLMRSCAKQGSTVLQAS